MASSIIDYLAERQDLVSPGISACVGCNVELTLRLVLKTLGPDTIVAIPPGCMGGVGVVGWGDTSGSRIPVFFPLLDNTASMLAGIKLHYQRLGRHVNVVAFAGDGATVDCGMQSLSGAAERGDNIIYVCYDNEGYMNTGFQRSGSTSKGSWTSTTPVTGELGGKPQAKKDFPMIMAMHDIPYLATASPAYVPDLVRKVQKAAANRSGLSYLHILNPCVNGWGFRPEDSIKVSRLSVQTRFHPLFEMENGRFRLSVNVKNPRPLAEYIDAFGKYRHLTPQARCEMQQDVNWRWERLLALVKARGPEEADPCR